MIIEFKKKYKINEFTFKNRTNPADMIQEITLIFTDDTTQTFSLRKTPDIMSYEIEPVVTQRITIQVKSLFTFSENVGGSFNFSGYPCTELETNPDAKQVSFLYRALKQHSITTVARNLKTIGS